MRRNTPPGPRPETVRSTPERFRGLLSGLALLAGSLAHGGDLGRELAVAEHLSDGDEFVLPTDELIAHGKLLFDAKWTTQDGAGRPQTTGTGAALADPGSPLLFPRNTNRISGPDANACAGCHNLPRSGGAGDRVANVFVLGQRFDFATFANSDPITTRGATDERGNPVTLQTIANERNTVGMFGAGYIEMIARQMTTRLQLRRNRLEPGAAIPLRAKGVDFGILRREADGSWDTSSVEGLPASSLVSDGPEAPPSLIIRPFHQAGAVISLREFSNNAFNHHHGIQSVERFGLGDPDQDGHSGELTRADITAVTLFQATLAVPGRVIPDDPQIEGAIFLGERLFRRVGCASCHKPVLRLTGNEWYSEPNPFNPPGNLGPGDGAEIALDLNDPGLDPPRLESAGRFTPVPAYTDLKLHDITSGPGDPNCEPLDMHFAPGTDDFFRGNCRFLTSRLWGVASSGPYFHHGKYSTMREAIEAHAGEAQPSRDQWDKLSVDKKNALIEFLKSLRVLPDGTPSTIVDEQFRPRDWPPLRLQVSP